VPVPSVGDWTLSYKGQAHTLLGITEDVFLKYKEKATITEVHVDPQSGRNDWQEGPTLGLDGSIVASFRSDSTRQKDPKFILTFRLSITIEEEVKLPKSIADIVEKYGKAKPELTELLARYSLRRRRYADGLFEEELGVLLADTIGKIVTSSVLGGNHTIASVSQLLDEVLELSAAVYVLPRIGTLDTPRLQTERMDSPYSIPSDPNDAYPSPIGSSIGWIRVPDVDDTRNRFINAPSAVLIVPIKPQHLELGFSLVNLDPSSKRVKEVIDRKKRLDAGKASVAAEDLAPETKELLSTLNPTNMVRPWLDDMNTPINSLTWQNVYPIVSAQNVRIPVDGFAHEVLTLDQIDITKETEKKPWWCFL